ncbi:luc7-like protein 3 isoform X1 [Haliotis rubra]|uniref:luc7-like protein 3 isoform X1 n=1 Tax=Haliotis rubra TaxID=36100 RepID=UPI001EE5ACFC|nr:luc7-like protein 3 isoform X1 [Haliotis rubra]
MMAAGAAAALLDELMGRDRNLAPSEQRSETHWSDPEVCKYFLCGFCPHELFVNTRADLGPCDKIHDDLLRKEYVKSSRFERMGYEDDFMRFLQGLISDVEKRIRRGHMRLALNSTQGSLNGNLPSQKEEKITMLTEKINELVNQAEQLGCEGKVEEAQGVMKLCDQLREERRQLENNPNAELPQLKQMEVCDTCGAFLIVGDMPQRLDEHLLGKQHAGYAQVRATVDKIKKKIQADVDEREAKEAKLAQEREEREKEREKEREDRRKKEKEKEDEKKREREKEREKRRKRSRSRSRRSRSRDRRSRSRDRRRSSSRDRKRRSRSRSRHRTGLEVETVISLAGTGQDQEVEVAGQEAEIEDQGVEDADHVAGIEGHVAEEKVDGHEVEIDVLAVETRAQGNAQEAETKTVRVEKKGRRVKRRITTGGSPQRKTRRKWGRR